MKRLDIPDVLLIGSNVFNDHRGLFLESFNKSYFEKTIGKEINFVQDNLSISKKGVLRGLHYQTPPYCQGKLIRVIHGKIIDVAVDIRKSSKFFGKYIIQELDSASKDMLWIPEGFAHGFVVLEENTSVLYKATNYYNQDCERSIFWNDSDIGINWQLKFEPIISQKDTKALSFQDSEKLE